MKKIVDAIKEKNIDKIEILINKKEYIDQIYSASTSNYILEYLLEEESNLEMLKYILGKQFIRPEVNNQKYFTLSCKKGYLEYAKAFIETGKIKIDYEFNLALRKAVEFNQIEMVKYLLTFEMTNPRSKNDEAIRIAAKKNFVEIINLLLDQELNIVSKNNAFIRKIISNNEFELFKKVFNNKNYKSRSTFIAAWEEAAICKNEPMMEYLMDRKDYNIMDKAHDLIKRLIEEDNLKYFKVLVEKMTTEEKEKNIYFALKQACQFNRLDIFKYIVEEQDVNPFTGRGKYLMIAIECGNPKIFKEVYKYKNEKLEKNLYYIIRAAMLNEALEELNILLKEKNSIHLAKTIIEKEKRTISKNVIALLKFNDF